MTEDITYRVVRGEQRQDDFDRRLMIVEQDTKPLERLTAIIEMNAKQDEKRDAQFEKMTEVMQGINLNLAALNKDVKEVKNEVSNVKSDVNTVSGRIDAMEEEKVSKLQKHQDRGVDLRWKIYASVITFFILGLLGMWFTFSQ